MFKKILLLSVLFGGVSLSGAASQSNSLILQAGSFIGILISIVILFAFMRIIVKSAGCLTSCLILCAIICFIMYAFGMFNNGIQGVPAAIKSFFGQRVEKQEQIDPIEAINNQAVAIQQGQLLGQDVISTDEENIPLNQQIINQPNTQQIMLQSQTSPSVQSYDNTTKNYDAPDLSLDIVQDVEELATQQVPPQNIQTQQESVPQDPVNLLATLPVLKGQARVINANMLSIRGRKVVLFGIDAPDLSQTCTDHRGKAYNCGQEAAQWLKNWLSTYEVECRIMKENSRGELLGVCMLGSYDISAALVNAGLAFSYQKMSDIYTPYEQQAKANGRGLWRGTFYMPWDWRKIKAQKPKIKIINQRKKRSMLGL